ncbi:unnamed protein product [Linum trigynum]|uniref:Uncharacterized protein n=1 Tax=Linum trigynum TaxID=586398 RepID=A0AAV2CW88_9ROSI
MSVCSPDLSLLQTYFGPLNLSLSSLSLAFVLQQSSMIYSSDGLSSSPATIQSEIDLLTIILSRLPSRPPSRSRAAYASFVASAAVACAS